MKRYNKPEMEIVTVCDDILMAISGAFDGTENADNFFDDFS